MSGMFPLIPVSGGSPLTYLFFAGLVGVAFGFFLERSGFGSSEKLTAVFTLRDWDVYRVMFTALVTAMIGSQLLAAFGVLEIGLLEVGTSYLGPMFVGGLIFGVGFYIGGFCPGTAVVAAVRGRLDAVVFLVGIVVGIFGFTLFFDGAGQASWFQSFYAPVGATVMSLTEHPLAWLLAIGITIGVMLSFRYLYIVEQRYAMLTPAQLAAKTPRPQAVRPQAVRPQAGRSTRAVIGFAAVVTVVLGIAAIGSDEPEVLAIGSELPASVEVDEEPLPSVDALSLVGWIISDAHRIAEETPPNSYVLDLRSEAGRNAVPIRGTQVVPAGDDGFEAVMDFLDGFLEPVDKNKPLVIVGEPDSALARELVTDLRVQGINAMLLDGGADAWQKQVLSTDTAWPEWVIGDTAGATTSSTVPTVSDYHNDVIAWMTGTTVDVPAYLSIPGTEQLPSEAATVIATGAGGGGCG